MSFKIGFMQGRLVPSEKKNFIQSFPWKNWKKEFYIAKKNNLKLIEWTIDYYKFNQNPLIDKKKIYVVKKISEKTGVKIVSVTCDFYMQKPYSEVNKFYFKKKIKKNIYDLILSCKILNIKNIVIPLVDNSSLKNKSDEKKTINFFLQFKNELKLSNIKILFEIDYKPKKILDFIQNFDKNYGINYDTGNSAALGFKFKDEKKYFHRVENIHIKDRVLNGSTVKLGYGNFKFNIFFSFLKKIKYKKNLILQTAKTWKKNETNEILDNIKFIKKFLK